MTDQARALRAFTIDHLLKRAAASKTVADAEYWGYQLGGAIASFKRLYPGHRLYRLTAEADENHPAVRLIRQLGLDQEGDS